VPDDDPIGRPDRPPDSSSSGISGLAAGPPALSGEARAALERLRSDFDRLAETYSTLGHLYVETADAEAFGNVEVVIGTAYSGRRPEGDFREIQRTWVGTSESHLFIDTDFGTLTAAARPSGSSRTWRGVPSRS
jgi:hypothetical protein